MASSEFFVDRRDSHFLKIFHWNINSVKNKLELPIVLKLFGGIDLIFLNELKTPLRFSVPGYETFRTMQTKGHRGGCAILVANYLVCDILSVNNSIKDVVSIRFKSLPGVVFICVYITPSDSPFFSLSNLAYINELMQTNPDDNIVIMGDLNSRFGPLIRKFLNNVLGCDYVQSEDNVQIANENAKVVQKALHSLVVINNLVSDSKTFKSHLTFRKKRQWISEVDYCVISSKLLESVSAFEINQDLNLPSDHAPMCVTFDVEKLSPGAVTKSLLDRSEDLGAHAVEIPSAGHGIYRRSRQIRLEDTDCERFYHELDLIDPPQDLDDLSECVEDLNATIREKLISSKKLVNTPPADPIVPDRWSRLLQRKDARDIWKAID